MAGNIENSRGARFNADKSVASMRWCPNTPARDPFGPARNVRPPDVTAQICLPSWFCNWPTRNLSVSVCRMGDPVSRPLRRILRQFDLGPYSA